MTNFIKRLSIVLRDEEFYTNNALANLKLPMICDWNTFSNEEKQEMLDFWCTIAGGANLGNHCYLYKVGIFAEEYVRLRAA